MYCENCGIEVDKNAAFCSQCGHPLMKKEQSFFTSYKNSFISKRKKTDKVLCKIAETTNLM